MSDVHIFFCSLPEDEIKKFKLNIRIFFAHLFIFRNINMESRLKYPSGNDVGEKSSEVNYSSITRHSFIYLDNIQRSYTLV